MKNKNLLLSSLISISITISFVSCSKKNGTQELTPAPQIIDQKTKNKDLITLAKQQDLPTPAGYKIKGYATGNNSELLVYAGNLAYSQVINFYKRELELSGWAYSDFSTKKEGLLTANKASTKCVISARPLKSNSSSIHVFIQKKPNISNPNGLIDLSKINGGSTRCS